MAFGNGTLLENFKRILCSTSKAQATSYVFEASPMFKNGHNVARSKTTTLLFHKGNSAEAMW